MAKRWYVVHTYSGYENKVKSDLEHRIETFGLEDQIVDVQIPTEEIVEIKDAGKEGGKRQTKTVKVFPGYVLVRMEVDDNSWAVVRNTPGVTGFVGIDGKPTPLRRSEFNKIMRRTSQKDDTAPKRTTTNLEPDTPIRVVKGPFKGYEGRVVDVTPDGERLHVTIQVFQRETRVELGIEQVTAMI